MPRPAAKPVDKIIPIVKPGPMDEFPHDLCSCEDPFEIIPHKDPDFARKETYLFDFCENASYNVKYDKNATDEDRKYVEKSYRLRHYKKLQHIATCRAHELDQIIVSIDALPDEARINRISRGTQEARLNRIEELLTRYSAACAELEHELGVTYY